MPINEMSVEEETKIEDISNDLYRRIADETERLLMSQFQALGVYPDDIHTVSGLLKKVLYPLESLSLATYEFNGQTILGVRIGEGRMSIEFDIPKLTQESQRGSKEDVGCEEK